MKNNYLILILILGLIILSLFILLKNTDNQREEVFATNNKISIPLTIHIIKDSENLLSTQRNKEDINRLIKETNRIWEQANIEVFIKNLHEEEYSTQEILNFRENPRILNRNFDEKSINAYLIREIGVNGIAYPYLKTIIVADTTTVNDYRTFAHEIGHVLTLKHVPEENRLLAQGRNGELLIDSEIEIAKAKAKTLF